MAFETIILGDAKVTDLSIERLADIVDQLRQCKDRIVEVPVKHRFTPGMYVREVMVPAGTGVITHVHKTEHPFVVSSGKILVWTPGHGAVTITAPYTGITKPGTIRVAVALEDTVWTTFHPNPNNEMDIEKLEKFLVFTPREAAQLKYEGPKCLS